MEIEQFCDDIKSEDSRGRQIYMMLSKTELGLFNMIDGTQRVIYKGPKSVAAFKQMKNGNLIVTQNYTETAVLEPTHVGHYRSIKSISSRDYDNKQIKKSILATDEKYIYLNSFAQLSKIKIGVGNEGMTCEHKYKPDGGQVYDFAIDEKLNKLILNDLKSSYTNIRILKLDNFQLMYTVVQEITMIYRFWYDADTKLMVGKEINGPIIKHF